MAGPELLTGDQIRELLAGGAEHRTRCEVSFTTGGRWYKYGMQLEDCGDDVVGLVPLDPRPAASALQPEMPVNVAFQQGYYTILFETVVAAVASGDASGRVTLRMPDRGQRLERRAYRRVPVPPDMRVEVQFWHRGYTDTEQQDPGLPEHHWQGLLRDLTAGGARITVGLDQTPCFRVRQVIGLQFTPMPHAQPVRLEGYVIHLSEDRDQQVLTIGVEFLGLEAHGEPRRTLQRLHEIVEFYESRSPVAASV